MLSTNPTIEMQAEPGGSHQSKWMWFVSVFSVAYFSITMIVSLAYLHHSFPLSMYMATTCFFVLHASIKNKMPRPRWFLVFIAGCVAVYSLLSILLQSIALLPLDISHLLEPVYFLPLGLSILLIRHAHGKERFIPRALIVVGASIIAMVVVLLVPGNPVVAWLKNPAGGMIDLVDARVPVDAVLSLLYYYAVPVAICAGSLSIMAGLLSSKTSVSQANASIINLVASVLLSLFVVGTPIAFLVLRDLLGTKKA